MRFPFHFVLLGAMFVPIRSSMDAFGGAEVTGTFGIPTDSYCVGEPIVVEFNVTNGRSSTFSFFEGGDHRFTLRHERYSFRVENAAGRNFTQDLGGNLGGEGDTIELKPGQAFRSWQLLNGWVHLLPPGSYRVHCERRLALDPEPAAKKGDGASNDPVAISQDLTFNVVPYSKERIVAAIGALQKIDELKDGAIRLFGVPFEWAVADLSRKFQTGLKTGGTDAALAALPAAWDDGYYVEYEFKANRNWLTPAKPGDFELTFSARNNGTSDLPHSLGESTLSVNGGAASGWAKSLKAMMDQQKLGKTLAPGAMAQFSGKFNDLLPSAGQAQVVWTVRGIARSVDVGIGR